MTTPRIPRKSPLPVLFEAGKTCYWCSCGHSKTPPFCDGAHQGSAFAPVPYRAEAAGMVYFCGCKRSKNGALCDGAHQAL